jgi:hypothetical protein
MRCTLSRCGVLLFQRDETHCRRRPYRVECTGSLLTSEVKQRRARSVLGWGTAWEDLRVLSAFVHVVRPVCISDMHTVWKIRATQTTLSVIRCTRNVLIVVHSQCSPARHGSCFVSCIQVAHIDGSSPTARPHLMHRISRPPKLSTAGPASTRVGLPGKTLGCCQCLCMWFIMCRSVMHLAWKLRATLTTLSVVGCIRNVLAVVQSQ